VRRHELSLIFKDMKRKTKQIKYEENEVEDEAGGRK
jgi:hypothetical protein